MSKRKCTEKNYLKLFQKIFYSINIDTEEGNVKQLKDY